MTDKHVLSEQRVRELARLHMPAIVTGSHTTLSDLRELTEKAIVQAADEAASQARLSEAEWWLDPKRYLKHRETWLIPGKTCKCEGCKRLAHLRTEAEKFSK